MDIERIHKYLEDINLEVMIELTLQKYQGEDYYLSIVYDNQTSKYKVLYLPLKIIDYENINRYTCFQFIDEYYINFIIKNINQFKDEFKYVKARNYKNKYIDNDLITLSIRMGEEYYKFYATEYFPKELDYLYELINVLFSYAPNIISEVGRQIVTLLEGKTSYIGYQDCIDFDLFNDNLDKLNHRKYRVDNLEYVNGKYYAIVDSHLIILKYLKYEKILYLYSDNHSDKYFYSIIDSIRKEKFIPFKRLKVMGLDGVRNYLTFDKNKIYYKVVNGSNIEQIPNNELAIEKEKDEIN